MRRVPEPVDAPDPAPSAGGAELLERAVERLRLIHEVVAGARAPHAIRGL